MGNYYFFFFIIFFLNIAKLPKYYLKVNREQKGAKWHDGELEHDFSNPESLIYEVFETKKKKLPFFEADRRPSAPPHNSVILSVFFN